MITLPVDSETSLQLPLATDSIELFALIDRNRTKLRQWLGWLDQTRGPGDLDGFIRSAAIDFAARTALRLLIRFQGRIAGVVELKDFFWKKRKGLIGYWVGEEFGGRSLARKAVRTIAGFGFRDWELERIEIRCAIGNLASQKVALGAGFRQVVVLRDNEWLYDRFVDHLVFSVWAAEWRPSSLTGLR